MVRHMNDIPFAVWDGAIEDQKQSGRCWIYASMSPIRQRLCERYGLSDVRLSTNYVYFFDQLEKSRMFLEGIEAWKARPLDDPLLCELLREPISSVGQWCCFASLVKRYGLVPLEAMPDTEATANEKRLTLRLSERLRFGAKELRRGTNTIPAILSDIEAILQDALGTPPKTFVWDDSVYTPQAFYGVCGYDETAYVMLIHHPSRRYPLGRAYHETEEPAARDPLWTTLNVGIETIRELTKRQLEKGEQVVFACDVRQAGSRKDGVLSTERYGRPLLDKADAIAYKQIKACHVMAFDGMSENGVFRVRDSHGLDTGTDGRYSMTRDWFDNFVLSAVIRKSLLPPDLLQLLDGNADYLPKMERF